jgi:peptide/nickel transport system ATP-binding protein
MMDTREQTALFEIKNLNVAFHRQRREPFAAVRDISFDIRENETVALVGESGSGKSVTALAMMGLLPGGSAEITGQLTYDGKNMLTEPEAERRRRRGSEWAMVFQEPMTSLNPVMTIGAQIMEVLRFKLHMPRVEARRRCVELLEEVALPDPEHALLRYPSQLSGGQQQRAMIAMALACEPKLLIADEPTTALDVTVQRQIMDLLRALKARHRMSVLFISHDLGLVGELADRIVVMRGGGIREVGAAERILTAPEDRYTQALIQCRPTLASQPRRLPVIEDFLDGMEGTGVRASSPMDSKECGQNARKQGEAEKPVIAAENKKTEIAASAESAPMEILMRVRGLRKTFVKREGLLRKHETAAVNDVSFDLKRGGTLGVVGESGSGKTTLAMMILRLLDSDGGSVEFDGTDILPLPEKTFHPYRRRMQIVFQNPYASLNPRFTVGQSLLEPLRLANADMPRKEAAHQALDWLRRVGLDEEAFYKYPHEFSGGQRQRVALARALTVRPEMVILDEPVSALDVSVQAQILNLLKDLQDELGVSYLFISHDLAVVRFLCGDVSVMQHGRVVENGATDEIFENPQTAYTRQLLEAVPGRRKV